MKPCFFQKIIISLLFSFLIGCENTEMKRDDTENQHLKLINRRLRIKLDETKLELDNSKIQLENLEEWSGDLVERVGPCVWFYSEYEKPLPYELVENATPQELTAKLNQLFKTADSPEVILVGIDNGIANVTISDEEKLTQRMGTAGATAYLYAVTYTLSSIKTIDCVDFKFKTGDHAIPGRYCP